jgi:CRP-like cAMP-binding protein
MKLEQLQIFHNLTEDEMQKSLICSQAVVQKYQKNEYIFRQGDRPEKLYFLLNGDVEVGSINLNGKVTRIGQVTEGEDFGEIELFLHHSAYSGYAKAKNEVKVLEVSKNFFGSRCGNNCVHHSKVVFNMLQVFAEKADKNNHQIEVLTSGNLRQRVATYLLENCNADNQVNLQMNREDLASYLNTTRPSLSRMLLNLQEEGTIRLAGRKTIEVLDHASLQLEE